METGARSAAAGATPAAATIRPLVREDFEAVVALDQQSSGQQRRAYFQKRLAVALREPKRHLQLAAVGAGGLQGFLLARVIGGEYGRPGSAVVLESIGVEAGARHAGLGRRMLAALEELAAARKIPLVITQAAWRDHAMLRFLDGARFTLAPRQIVERPVFRQPLPEDDEEIERQLPVVRMLRAGDFAAVARIDRQITGQDRSEYLRRKFDEVLHESAIEVSLVVEDDGLPVGFVMVRVDFGAFGNVEPVASLDTIGVSPGFAKRGFASALLTQLVENLAALHVERLETEVARDTFGLLGFLYKHGFGPSQRVPFERQLQ